MIRDPQHVLQSIRQAFVALTVFYREMLARRDGTVLASVKTKDPVEVDCHQPVVLTAL